MLKYPCLVLDHDETVVQSEKTIGYPCFCQTLSRIRPGSIAASGAGFGATGRYRRHYRLFRGIRYPDPTVENPSVRPGASPLV